MVHCITNYVTVNDCANVLLACGGSPIMTDEIEEVEDIAAISKALVINIGTLNQRTVASMLAAGKKANTVGIPVVLDPVGAGASAFRNQTCKKLLDNVDFAVIRGNISEIKALALGSGSTKGVDASVADRVSDGDLDSVIAFMQDFSQKTGAVIVVSGATDIVVYGEKAALIKNGHPMMADITGSGCMLSAFLGAFAGANADKFEAVAAAMCYYGYAGELAQRRTSADDAGNASFRNNLIDAVYLMDIEELIKGAKYETR
ncbi:MAG: hydroxyethylthiazole kinase [Bacillota bacterium]